jgi:3-isopropylmalate/(R)-2-methylmalate dehydratase small subunit
MDKFSTLKSIPVHMPLSNIDTDMIIPKQFLKTIKRTGLGKNLFYEMRYDEKGNLIENFILNKKPFNESKIILAGKNFGCGSSREHAPWALLDFGIKCVIANSFADIFYNNCFKNGILPIVLDEKNIQELAEYSKRETDIEVKIETQEILYGNKTVKFDLDTFKKKCLIEGTDDIALSLEKSTDIQNYENKIKDDKPWLTNNDQS